VWRLAGPIMLSNVSTPLLGAVDTAVVGHLPDPAYIGGVALGAVIFNFLYWGFGFLRMGTTGFTAQAYGAADRAEIGATLVRPLLLAAGLGLALIALQDPIGLLAQKLIEGSAQVKSYADIYYRIRIWSAPAALANYAILGWLLGTQRPRTALALQIGLNGINIALDLVFVLGLGWDVAGVASATLVAEIAAALAGLAVALRIASRIGGGPDWARVLRRERLLALLRVNADIFVRTLCLVAAFAYFTAQGARMGDVPLAANAILMNLQQFMAYGLDGFAHAAEILAGGAIGAGSRSAFREVVRITSAWAVATAAAVAAIYAALGPLIVAAFTAIPEVRAAAAGYLPWMILSPLVSVWSFQLDGIFIGATRTAEMRNAMLLSLALFLGACRLLVPALGNDGLWLAFVLFMAARALTLGAFFPRLARAVG